MRRNICSWFGSPVQNLAVQQKPKNIICSCYSQLFCCLNTTGSDYEVIELHILYDLLKFEVTASVEQLEHNEVYKVKVFSSVIVLSAAWFDGSESFCFYYCYYNYH